MTEPRESEWQRVLNCVRTLTGKDMTVGEMADACNTDAGAIVAALEELGVRPGEVVQAGDGCLSPEGLVSAVMVVVVEPAVKGGGALCA
jgi:hypothetical protein